MTRAARGSHGSNVSWLPVGDCVIILSIGRSKWRNTCHHAATHSRRDESTGLNTLVLLRSRPNIASATDLPR